MSSSLLKNPNYKMCLQIIYLVCMNKEDLAFNNLYAMKPNPTKSDLVVSGMNKYVQLEVWKLIYHIPKSINTK